MGCCQSKQEEFPVVKNEFSNIDRSVNQIEETGSCQGKEEESPVVNNKFVNESSRMNHNETENHKADTDARSQPTNILKAMFDYKGLEEGDLSFAQGERFILLKGGEKVGWWWARRRDTGEEGYIPSTYVVPDNDDYTSQDWWFNMNRQDANKQLLLAGNPNGTFLVRESRVTGVLALSVRFLDADHPEDRGIRHYQIHFTNDGVHCYINKTTPFTNVISLIDYYKEILELCCKLLRACPNIPDPVPLKDIEINKESIILTERLGSGNFGEVWKGKLYKTLDVAVKKLKPGSMLPDAFLQEATIMNDLRHPKLVNLLGVSTSSEPIYIVTELMVNGALKDYLRSNKDLTLLTRIGMAAQVADGMRYLEKQNFVHRDVRAANMLVGENLEVKVADFGLARFLDDDEYQISTGSQFPVKWTAPEGINQGTFTTKSDVWSFGILLYEILTFAQIPYPGLSNKEVIPMVNNGYRMLCPKDYPDDVNDQMQKCWTFEPEKRPTFAQLFDFLEKYEVSDYSRYNE